MGIPSTLCAAGGALRAIAAIASVAAILAAATAQGAAVSGAPPALETGPLLTADRLVAMVLDANAGLAAADAAANAAAHRVEPAGALDDPMLSYGVAPLTAGADRSLNQSIDVSQKIPWPGTLAARESAARHGEIAARRNAESWRLRLTAEAKSAYAEWRYVASALDIHHATRALLDELIAAAETRYAAGRASKQDVLQAEVARADLDKHLLLLLRQRATALADINALLNRAPETPVPPAAPISLQPPPPTLDALQDAALARHPELARLEAELSAQESRVTLAEKEFYPSFQIGAGYDSLWDPVDKRPVLKVSINVPFDRGKRRSALDTAVAETRRAKYSLSERRAALLAALAIARAEVLEARDAVTLFQDELLPLAAEYLDAAIADYRSGAGAFLNVVTAERRKLDTELELARTRADYVRRAAELELWAGGPLGFSLPQTAGAEQ